ncbi:hypothetical protein A3F66_01510 [candidate division TM6 bacterium RIFCSPHIGHO2_12_FULL_32_22]|nr:MAG: hypothetical protein A3F66_01510 [candidate division TM6 bacterium RIFCSPHIGHO2_12_FULL_32_22]
MKKLFMILPILLLLPACFKKKPVLTADKGQKPVCGLKTCQPGKPTKVDEDVEEFFLEDDEDGNVFEKGQPIVDQELEMVSLPLEKQATETVQFDYDRTKIRPEESAKIDKNAAQAKEILKENADAIVVVKGHSCKIAKNQTYNYMISQERAEHVAKEYVKKGVPQEKVKAVGHGSSELLTNAEGKDAQAINRRAETSFKKV